MSNPAATSDELATLTQRFFQLHWGRSPGSPPSWLELNPQAVPACADDGGCYAVTDPGGKLLYVGLALAERRGSRPGARGGLMRRLMRHVLRRGALSKGEIQSKREAWNEHGGIGSIWLLPFPVEVAYLAAALEVFVIQELSGRLPMNKSRVRAELGHAVIAEDANN